MSHGRQVKKGVLLVDGQFIIDHNGEKESLAKEKEKEAKEAKEKEKEKDFLSRNINEDEDEDDGYENGKATINAKKRRKELAELIPVCNFLIFLFVVFGLTSFVVHFYFVSESSCGAKR